MKPCKGCKYLCPNDHFCRYGVPSKKTIAHPASGGVKEVRCTIYDAESTTSMRSENGKCGPEATLYEREETISFGCFVTISIAIITLLYFLIR
jgi:hypothetical protein